MSMEGRISTKLVLDGLCCSNCAMKIEQKVSELKEVSHTSLNFATKLLLIETEQGNSQEELLQKVKKIVKDIEPEVVVKEYKSPRAKRVKAQVQVPKQEGEQRQDGCSDGCCGGHGHGHAQDEHIHHGHYGAEDHSHEEEDEHGHSHSHGEGGSLKKKIIKFGISAVIFAIAMIFDLPKSVSFGLFFISYLLSGGDVLLKAGKNILRGDVFDENFLMGIATIGAFAIGEFAEGVGVMLFYQVGEMFQDLAVNRSRKSIADLMDIRPDYANLIIDGIAKKVAPEEIDIGQLILVKPGEKVPLDGKVVEGTSMIDSSALTGESVPREVVPGDNVLGGFINKNGVLTIEVMKDFEESTVSKILDLVQNASSRKAPTENFITKFARRYTPVVTITAALMAILPPLILPGATFSEWVYRALIFLVISCPCALVISIPLGFFGGIGGASRHGVLIKGSNYLEALNYVDTVIFDKTGTLTKGVFKVTQMNTVEDISKEQLLEYAAYAESYSNHPIALSIQKAYGREIDKEQLEEYEEIAGHGIKVRLNDKMIYAGNAKLMEKEAIAYDKTDFLGTVVHIGINGTYAGNIIISDEVKEDSAKAMKELKEIGMKKLVMLTGDSKSVGEKIGRQLGLDEVHAELLPDQKVEQLEAIYKQKAGKGKLIFVGDGINDAPVLARADIGVAMGGLGSDAAIEAADVVLMTDEPSKLISAIKIAKKTHTIVWQNIVFALAIKAVFLILGAFGVANMWEAVFADVGVALIAVLNAMRAMKIK
ncbi:cadmium transporter [Anaerocolumna cellulosilytica]|uniref:Cadmium transporter n=1 Tax=Anaerocolumna cellulosilytica TaxID=433286 RepID=A0A6S6QZ83_9FIRM|nr:Cd2+/Zn2+-exporting ATPase [Anaerocolumna cellulosilytica]BCJ92705.1 cadmium transporter [Anaerocolumna cellulosilytica]